MGTNAAEISRRQNIRRWRNRRRDDADPSLGREKAKRKWGNMVHMGNGIYPVAGKCAVGNMEARLWGETALMRNLIGEDPKGGFQISEGVFAGGMLDYTEWESNHLERRENMMILGRQRR